MQENKSGCFFPNAEACQVFFPVYRHSSDNKFVMDGFKFKFKLIGSSVADPKL